MRFFSPIFDVSLTLPYALSRNKCLLCLRFTLDKMEREMHDEVQVQRTHCHRAIYGVCCTLCITTEKTLHAIQMR